MMILPTLTLDKLRNYTGTLHKRLGVLLITDEAWIDILGDRYTERKLFWAFLRTFYIITSEFDYSTRIHFLYASSEHFDEVDDGVCCPIYKFDIVDKYNPRIENIRKIL